MKRLIKNYLSVTKKEWNGLVILMVLIALVLAAPYGYQLMHNSNMVNPKGFAAAAARLRYNITEQDSVITHPELFNFNPNHLPNAQWKKLGLSNSQISVIKNYEEHGGRFYHKQDLKKVYSITASDYKRLEPYINLPNGADDENKPFVIVELNSADSAKMTTIKGVGPGYAIRILRYRDRLGGFYCKEQLKEVFGIDSLTYLDLAPQVRVDAGKIVKININKVTLNNLLVFPYLTYKQKNALVEYRAQHGDYTALTDMKKIPIIDDGILRKIEPYIVFK